MKEKWLEIYDKDGTKTVIASLLSILIGLLVGCVIVLIVGLTNGSLGAASVWDGIRLVLGGILSTGRDASGSLTFGFNPTNVGNMLFRATPLILTGLSVAVAFKTGLFNIGAPGQYLMGTAATLVVALSIPTTVVPAPAAWRNTARRGTFTRHPTTGWRRPRRGWTCCSPALRSTGALSSRW